MARRPLSASLGYTRQQGQAAALPLDAQYGHKRVIKLLDHGADIEALCEPFGTPMTVSNRAGNTLLHWTAAGDDTGGRQVSVARLLGPARQGVSGP